MVEFFKPEDIVSIMVAGNKDNYSFNSHSSFCNWFFKGNKAKQEDQWNKWEYNPEKDILEKDSLVTIDDSKQVNKILKDWFKDKDILYLRNLYGRNTGDSNTGDRNTGGRNTGDRNTGHWNTGDSNTGDRNTGGRNTGHWNTGDWNTGDRNTGDWNTGHWNTGDSNTGGRNTGDRNTGHSNTGHWNTGDWNTGHWNTGHSNTGDSNTGHWNTGDYSSGFFCTGPDIPRLFNKPCSEEAAKKVRERYFYLSLTEWIDSGDMTKAEKEAHEFYETLGGYLKKNSYQEAWEIFAKREPKTIEEIQTWENFDKKIFKEITGLSV